MPDQLAYLHFVTLTILNALKRLPEMYLNDPEVRAVVPLTEIEDHWLRDAWGPSQRDNNPVIGRLDGVIEFTSPMWKDSLKLIEPNLSGVGGIHLCPTAEQLLVDLVLPVLQQTDPKLVMEQGQDLRELFIQEVIDHLEAIGRKGHHVCFIEPKYSGTGIDEQAPLADYYLHRHGLKIMHADPAELYLRDGEVWYGDSPVDIAYRDYEVRDLIALEQEEGVNIEPLRVLFRENRIISSMAGEFDHKSSWEIADRSAIRQILQSRRAAGLPAARALDAAGLRSPHDAARRQHRRPARVRARRARDSGAQAESLVRRRSRDPRPSRHTSRNGRRRSRLALADPANPWVVQRLAAIPVSEFPVLDSDGTRRCRAVLSRDGLRADEIRPGDPRPGVAEASRQRRPARRHVRRAHRPARWTPDRTRRIRG